MGPKMVKTAQELFENGQKLSKNGKKRAFTHKKDQQWSKIKIAAFVISVPLFCQWAKGGKGKKDLAKKKSRFFFSKKKSWVVAPIFDGLDVGIQKMSQKKKCFAPPTPYC